MSVGSTITGTGSAFPAYEMKNAEFESFLDTTDEWIRTRTGIETRRIADPKRGESTASLALEASERAMEMAHLGGSDLDLITVGTVTPDTVMPCTANQLQARLGASRAFGFDLQAACSGFLYGLTIADEFIRGGRVNTALVVGVETLSTLTHWKDRSTCVLFGDGAGAVILRKTENDTHRILSTELYSDGTLADLLYIPHGYSKIPPYSADYRLTKHKIIMNGKEVFKFAVKNMVETSKKTLERNRVTVSDVDLFIFHQANIRIIDRCAQVLEIDRKKILINVHKYGNTSSATLPAGLDEAWRNQVVGPGSLVLMVTFGGGVTWGSALMRL